MDQDSVPDMDQSATPQSRRRRVVSPHQALVADILHLRAHEQVQISEKVSLWNERADQVWIWCSDQRGNSGWVPLSYLDIDQSRRHGELLRDYTSAELSVNSGELLSVETTESGWAWCTNALGRSGWVPLECLE
jgi:uncharacterized protein YgiM (DUF1202 family)